jgi:hypothetical protein
LILFFFCSIIFVRCLQKLQTDEWGEKQHARKRKKKNKKQKKEEEVKTYYITKKNDMTS